MALGDFTIYQQASNQGGRGSRLINVASSVGLINAGEPVFIIAGATSVIPNVSTNLITISSPFVPFSVTGTGLVGIAQTTSTNTSSAAGSVNVCPANAGTTWLVNSNNSTSVNTQAKYDALVGHRVLIDYTAGVYTALLSDSALNGFIIQELDVVKFPGKVALSILPGIIAE